MFGQLPLEDRFIVAVARQALLAEDQDQLTGAPSALRTLGVQLLATRGEMMGRRLPAASSLVRASCAGGGSSGASRSAGHA